MSNAVGCGHEHNCGIHGCAVIRQAAERLAELHGVQIDFGAGAVCKPVNLTIRAGERIALQGPNGCGKSSLLKLLCGQEIPHSGELWRGNGLKTSYVSQNVSWLCGSVAEFLRGSGVDESLFFTILVKLGVPKAQLERELSGLSTGQKKKVLIARSLCEQAHLHVWDEPMNYIDVIARIQIEQMLLEFRPTLIFAEHDRAFCERTATQTVMMEAL